MHARRGQAPAYSTLRHLKMACYTGVEEGNFNIGPASKYERTELASELWASLWSKIVTIFGSVVSFVLLVGEGLVAYYIKLPLQCWLPI